MFTTIVTLLCVLCDVVRGQVTGAKLADGEIMPGVPTAHISIKAPGNGTEVPYLMAAFGTVPYGVDVQCVLTPCQRSLSCDRSNLHGDSLAEA